MILISVIIKGAQMVTLPKHIPGHRDAIAKIGGCAGQE
jgi:hypothetical protein